MSNRSRHLMSLQDKWYFALAVVKSFSLLVLCYPYVILPSIASCSVCIPLSWHSRLCTFIDSLPTKTLRGEHSRQTQSFVFIDCAFDIAPQRYFQELFGLVLFIKEGVLVLFLLVDRCKWPPAKRIQKCSANFLHHIIAAIDEVLDNCRLINSGTLRWLDGVLLLQDVKSLRTSSEY